MTRTEETEAIAALRRGESGGLEVLIELHQLWALRFAYSITGSRAEAEDVVADAFIAVYEHLDQLHPERAFKPWFNRIVYNRAISVTRKAARMHRILGFLGRQPTRSPDPEAEAESNSFHRQLVAVVHALPLNERLVIVLRYFEDMGEQEIGILLAWPLGTVKTRLRRARLKLRDQLTDKNGVWAYSLTGGNR
ncbi:MAG: RNA polymerase sigma factor [Candidatus Dormibacteraceae bacterium]